MTWATPLTSSGGVLNKVGSGMLTLTASNSYSGATTISAGTLSIGNGTTDGSIANAGGVAVANNATLMYDLLGNQTYSGVISGSGGLAKTGTGMLTLSNANTFSGPIALGAGTLNIIGNGGGSTGLTGTNLVTGTASVVIGLSTGQVIYHLNGNSTYSGGTTIIGSGSNTLVAYANSTGTSGNFGTGPINIIGNTSMRATSNNNVTVGNAVTLGGNFTVPNGGDSLTFTGPLTLSGSSQTLENDSTAALTFSGAIGDGGNGYGITKAGSGLIVFAGSNTYTGGTAILAGTLQIGGGTASGGEFLASPTIANSGSLVFSHTDALTYAGAISGTGSLSKQGTGTLTLTGTNTYTGTTTLGGGTVNLGVAENAGTSGPLGSSTAVGSIVLNGGYLQYSALNQNDYSHRFSTANNQAYNVDTNGQNVTWATPLNSASGSLSKVGAGTLTLTASNSYSGPTAVSGGTLDLSNQYALQNSTLTLSGGSAVFDSSVGGNAFTLGGLAGTAGSNLVLQNNPATPAPIALTVGGNNATTAFAANLGGSGSLIKVGTGALALSGTSTFSGGVTLSAGTLDINSATALGSGTFSIAAGAAIDNTSTGIVTVSNSSAETWNGNFTFGGSQHSLTLGTGPVTLGASCQLTVAQFQLTVPGNIGDGGQGYGLTKVGAGSTLVLSGSNTYTGPTAVTAGTLDIGSGGAGEFLASPTIADSGSLIFNHSDSLTYVGVISGSGSLTKQGGGTLTLTGTNTYTGTTTLTTGSVNLGVAETAGVCGPLGSSTAVGSIVLGGGYLQYSPVNQYDYSGRFSTAASQQYRVDTNGQSVTWATPLVSASGSLTKVGAGTLTLTASNTYTGTTTLSGGTVNLGAAETPGFSGPLGSSTASSSIVLNGGYLQYSAVNQYDYSSRFSTANSQAYNVDTNGQNVTWAAALTSSGGSLTKVGAGMLTLTASNSYSGATTVSGGTLTAANNAALGTGAVTLNSTSAPTLAFSAPRRQSVRSVPAARARPTFSWPPAAAPRI